MTSFFTRLARPDETDAIWALSDQAFGLAFNSSYESRLIRALQADGDSLLLLVAEADNGSIVGHTEFFLIWIDARPLAAGLGPMSARPGRQKTGIGSHLVRTGLEEFDTLGETIVFVLGDAACYPRFGSNTATAAPFTVPWSGPPCMASALPKAARPPARSPIPGPSQADRQIACRSRR